MRLVVARKAVVLEISSDSMVYYIVSESRPGASYRRPQVQPLLPSWWLVDWWLMLDDG